MTRATTPHQATRDLALVATFSGIIAALGLLPAITPVGIPVPITAQTLGVMLVGAVLGARRGAASMALFLALVALGLPLLAGGRGGLGVFAGPSVGYLVGFVVCAWVVGWLTEQGGATYRLHWGIVANIAGGILVMYALGIVGTAWRADVSITTATVQAGWYVVGDLAKAVIAAFVARGVHAAYPGMLEGRTSFVGRLRGGRDRDRAAV
ncbi:MAG TPA: biotin transporter BioY [Marmoricola sp.]